jgi:hypothetical protein
MRRPGLLRFASDDFMDDLTALLRDRPADVADHRAAPASFRETPPGAPDDWQPTAARLKLYQPFHGDFNLVVASLVCGLTGLPDHSVRPADAERVGFVLRRLADGTELAWSVDADGARRWVPLPAGAEEGTAAGEELFPVFPVGYPEAGRVRRLYAGLIPTSNRETFRTTGKATGVEPFPSGGPPGTRQDDDPRWNAFDVKVVGPLEDLQATQPGRPRPAADLRPEASAFVLLDFADLLRRHLPDVWAALGAGQPPTDPESAALYAYLVADPGVGWRVGLRDAAAQWAVLTGEADGTPDLTWDLHASTLVPQVLQARFRAALPGTPPPPRTPPGLDVPKIEPTGEARYVVRCVYRRPRCAPTEVVSAPSVPFSIAPVLDPDAPVRQFRIPLPVDTGIKDLRKFRKNVGFVLSNQLRGQMNRVTGLQAAMDGDLADEEHWDLGVLCSFSLPIITIVALLLLILIVILLNIVFFWLPFFRICLPIPVRSRS